MVLFSFSSYLWTAPLFFNQEHPASTSYMLWRSNPCHCPSSQICVPRSSVPLVSPTQGNWCRWTNESGKGPGTWRSCPIVCQLLYISGLISSFVLSFSWVSNEDYLMGVRFDSSFKGREEAGRLTVGKEDAIKDGDSPLSSSSILLLI